MRSFKFRCRDNIRPYEYYYWNIKEECPIEIGNRRFTNVEQYTGFIDKNGKEIYEGDIMLAYGHKWNIIFSEGAFVAKYRWEYRSLRLMYGEVI